MTLKSVTFSRTDSGTLVITLTGDWKRANGSPAAHEKIDPDGWLWNSVIASTGQPRKIL